MSEQKLLFEELTEKIIGCAFDVTNELGSGFLESVYQKAMMIALTDIRLVAECQKPIAVSFRSKNVGDFFADLFVESKIIVELKAVKELAPEHHAQIINYLKASDIQVGLLINFGNPKLEYRRFTRRKQEGN